MSKLPSGLVMCAALLMTGCGTAEYDWNKAMSAGTLPAYQTFVKNHPTGRRADDARGRILALRDDQTWATAQATHTVAAYREYLQTESGGIHAADAQYEIDALQRAAALKAVQSAAHG
jgi:major membrane immunogen (membrane-anchored lipoprotein)